MTAVMLKTLLDEVFSGKELNEQVEDEIAVLLPFMGQIQIAGYAEQARTFASRWAGMEPHYGRSIEAQNERINQQLYLHQIIENVFRILRIESPTITEWGSGPGFQTNALLRYATVDVVESSQEMVAYNHSFTLGGVRDYYTADIMQWEPSHRYDGVVSFFLWSHFPLPYKDKDIMYNDVIKLIKKARRSVRLGCPIIFVDSCEPQRNGYASYLNTNEQLLSHIMVKGNRIEKRLIPDTNEYFYVLKNFFYKDAEYMNVGGVKYHSTVQTPWFNAVVFIAE